MHKLGSSTIKYSTKEFKKVVSELLGNIKPDLWIHLLMELKIEVPKYDPNSGIKYKWENNFEIEIKNENNMITLVANKAGLISLANHLLNLAQNDIPSGYHLHFDENNSLEEGSAELTICKK